MPRIGKLILVAAALVPWLLPCAASAAESGKKTWEFADGDWPLVDQPTGEGYVDNPTLDQAEALLVKRRHGAARDKLLRWLKRNLDAPDRDRGLFLLAEAYYQKGDRIRAFYHLDELMDYYPESRLFTPALEKQYAIADRYLKGYKRRLMGMPILDARDEAIEMLFRIRERSPGSPIAERALLRTADHYYATSQFDLAADAYGFYVQAYPRSPDTPRVRLRQAYSSLNQSRGVWYDVTPLVDAKIQMQQIQLTHPELAEEENVAGRIERINATLAAKLYSSADYYRRTNEPAAAVYNWRYLIAAYPDTGYAERAQAELERMPQWALDLPAPQAGSEISSGPGDTGSSLTPEAEPEKSETPLGPELERR